MHPRSRQKLIDIVVEAVVYAVDVSAPTSPLSIAHTTFGEPSNPSLKVRGVEAVAELMIFDLDHVPTSLDSGRQLLMLANGGKGGIILDPAQDVRYTGGVHKLLLMGRASGDGSLAGAIFI
jgi:hypothetical protein